jgi:hypothetical protein
MIINLCRAVGAINKGTNAAMGTIDGVEKRRTTQTRISALQCVVQSTPAGSADVPTDGQDLVTSVTPNGARAGVRRAKA